MSAIYYLFSSQRVTKFRHQRVGVSASRQLIIYLVHKDLLSSGISVSACPDMFSLVLIYIILGISARLMFSLTNVHIGTSA